MNPEEKDIIKKLDAFENELQPTLEKTKSEIIETRYYETFYINGIKFNNIFDTTIKDEKGNITRHICSGNASNEIISIDENGQVKIKNPELAKYLGEIDLEKIVKENEVEQGRLKGISKTAKPEEIAPKEPEEQDEETQQVEQDLKQQDEDLEIGKYRKIKDSKINERMPEVFENTTENGVAFSNKLNRFVIISKINGQYQINEKIEPAKITWKTIISIDADGNKIEKKVPHSLMRLPDNPEKEIAVTLDQYGDPDIETVKVLSGQQRVARAVRTENESQIEEENRETTMDIENEGIYAELDLASKKEILEKEYGVTETNLEELRTLDIEALIEKEANKANVSKQGFKDYVKRAEGKTLKDKINNAQEDIIQEYKGNKRPR